MKKIYEKPQTEILAMTVFFSTLLVVSFHEHCTKGVFADQAPCATEDRRAIVIKFLFHIVFIVCIRF